MLTCASPVSSCASCPHRILAKSTTSYQSLEILSLRSGVNTGAHWSGSLFNSLITGYHLVLPVLHVREVSQFPVSVSSSGQGYFEGADPFASEDLSLNHSGHTPVTYVLEFCPLVTLVHIRGRLRVELHLRANSSEWPSFQGEVSSGLECTTGPEGSSLSGTLVKEGAVWVCGKPSNRIG